jgi:hypothetical protein
LTRHGFELDVSAPFEAPFDVMRLVSARLSV